MSSYFVIDTNVVVAGLLTSHANSPVARILDSMLGATFAFVLSQALLTEYRTVLVRPHLRKLHYLSEAEIEVILMDLARHAIMLTPIEPTQAPAAPVPGDQFLWNLLASRVDLVLVMGDKLLLKDALMLPRVISPQMFVAQMLL